MVALDLPLRHRVVGRPTGVLPPLGFEDPAQLARHIARPVVCEHPRPMPHTRTRSSLASARAFSSVYWTSVAAIVGMSFQARM